MAAKTALVEAGLQCPTWPGPFGQNQKAPFSPNNFGPGAMLTDGRYKLSVYYDDICELYDLETDPQGAGQPVRRPRAQGRARAADAGVVQAADRRRRARTKGSSSGRRITATRATRPSRSPHKRRKQLMPKDILVLMTDQHRADWIGAYGADWVRTPTLDKLASEGVIFTNCQTTCPVCMPARTSFLTGMYPHNFGMWDNVGRLQDTGETYLHPLRAAGYRTCHVGKSHLHPHGGGRDLRDAEPYMHALGWDDVLECTGPLSTQSTKSILTDWMEANGIYQTFLDDYRKRSETSIGAGSLADAAAGWQAQRRLHGQHGRGLHIEIRSFAAAVHVRRAWRTAQPVRRAGEVRHV